MLEPGWGIVRRFAPWLALGLAALLIAWLGPASCRRHAADAARARLDTAQAHAAAASGRDAVDTVGQAAARDAQSETITRRNAQEIDHAKGADAAVDAAVDDAGIASLCRRAAYRDRQRCRLRQPGAGGVAGGGGGGPAA